MKIFFQSTKGLKSIKYIFDIDNLNEFFLMLVDVASIVFVCTPVSLFIKLTE